MIQTYKYNLAKLGEEYVVYDSVAFFEEAWLREKDTLIAKGWEQIKIEGKLNGNNIVYIRRVLDNGKDS